MLEMQVNTVREQQHNARDADEQCERNNNTMLEMQMKNVRGRTTQF